MAKQKGTAEKHGKQKDRKITTMNSTLRNFTKQEKEEEKRRKR